MTQGDLKFPLIYKIRVSVSICAFSIIDKEIIESYNDSKKMKR